VVKSFKNHNRDKEHDEFEEDLTKGKSLEEKAPGAPDPVAMERKKQTNISRGKNENF